MCVYVYTLTHHNVYVAMLCKPVLCGECRGTGVGWVVLRWHWLKHNPCVSISVLVNTPMRSTHFMWSLVDRV